MSTTAIKDQQNGTPAKPDPWGKEVEFVPFMGDTPIKLSVNLVLSHLCKPTASGKVCTHSQALKFVMLCMARKLNPWEGDAFLVGFDSKDGPEFNLITAHQAFLKRAEAHPQFDGMESGVVVVRGEEVVELQGDLVWGDDQLIGGWAKVYRRDREVPTYRRLKLATFNTGRSRWNKDPAGMIVKCTEADALRSSFPNTLGGCFTEGELDDRPVRQTPQQRVAGIKAAAPAIANGTHTPTEIVVQPDVGEVEPVLSPVQQHAKAIEESESAKDLEAAYQSAFADGRLSRGEKARIAGLRDQRKAALESNESGEDAGPSEADMAEWDRQQDAVERTK